MFDQNWRTFSLILSGSYEKERTIRSDSKQNMISLQTPDGNSGPSGNDNLRLYALFLGY